MATGRNRVKSLPWNDHHGIIALTRMYQSCLERGHKKFNDHRVEII